MDSGQAGSERGEIKNSAGTGLGREQARAERERAAAGEGAAARAATARHRRAAVAARARAAERDRKAAKADPGDAAQQPAELPPERYLDREQSWLRFSERVLELAEDERVPLLERVRFVSIFASALDEFFMVRVAGRIRRMATGLPVENATGRPPREILENTLEMARELSARHAQCFSDSIVPALAGEGIEILRWKELAPREQESLQRLFRERIYPVLTPLAVDPAHPSRSSPACRSAWR